jgi:hypothetical protein
MDMIIILEQFKKWISGESKERKIARQESVNTPEPAQPTPAMDAFNQAASAYQNQLANSTAMNHMAQQMNMANSQPLSSLVYQQLSAYKARQPVHFETAVMELVKSSPEIEKLNSFRGFQCEFAKVIEMSFWLKENCCGDAFILPVNMIGFVACFQEQDDAILFDLTYGDVTLIKID